MHIHCELLDYGSLPPAENKEINVVHRIQLPHIVTQAPWVFKTNHWLFLSSLKRCLPRESTTALQHCIGSFKAAHQSSSLFQSYTYIIVK